MSQKRPDRPTAASRTASSGAGRSRLVTVIVAVAVVGFAALIAVLSAQESASLLTVDEVAGPVTVTGDPLPPLPDGAETDPLAGSPAPVVEGIDFDGTPVTVGAPGRPQVLLFLASWCPVCQRELPEVVRFVDGGGVPDGVELVAVITSLTDQRPNWPPQAWLETEGWTGVSIRDDAASRIAATYGMTGTPYWVVIDADGRIVRRKSGYLEPELLPDLFAAALG